MPMFEGKAFSPPALLTANVGSSDTVISVTDITVFPSAPNFATIGTDADAETIQYSAIVENSLSGCIRGVEGIARIWAQDTPISRNFTDIDYSRLVSNIKTVSDALGGKADLVNGVVPMEQLPFDGASYTHYFTATEWAVPAPPQTVHTIVIPATVHGIGAELSTDLQMLMGNDYAKIDNAPGERRGTKIDKDSGDVLIYSATPFAGRIILSGTGDVTGVSDEALAELRDWTEDNFWSKSVMRRVNWKLPFDPDHYIYVSPAGSDDNDGTQASPFATLGKALEVGGLYTRDSRLQIQLAAGDYYENDLSIQGFSNLYINAIGRPTLHMSGQLRIDSTSGMLSNFDISVEYVLNSGEAAVSALMSNIWFYGMNVESAVTQTNSGSIGIGAGSGNSFSATGNAPDNRINGFHIGVQCTYSEAWVSCRGEALATAYSVDRGFINVLAAGTYIPILAPTPVQESNSGRVRFSHLQGFNNTITIHVSPDGNDANWGQSAAYPVKTLARARDIAQRCEGTGSIVIQLADGAYDIGATVVFNGISRRLRILGNSANRNAVTTQINHVGGGFDFVSCAGVETENFAYRRTVAANASTFVARWFRSPGAILRCDVTSDVPETVSSSVAFALYGAGLAVNGCVISNMGRGLYATGGGVLSTYDVTGANNIIGYVAEAGIIIKSGHVLSAATPLTKLFGGQISDNGTWI